MNRYYYYIRKYLSKVSILINIIFLITETIINFENYPDKFNNFNIKT